MQIVVKIYIYFFNELFCTIVSNILESIDDLRSDRGMLMQQRG